MILAFKNISLNYNGRKVLNDLSGQIEQSKVHAVVGPNGAGKSTLISALAGLNQYGGSVYYDLKDISKESYSELAKQRAFCQQNAKLEINFTVRELLEFGIESGGYASANEFKTHVQFIASYCGIEKFLDHRILNLSGGEQQLVHFARAVAQVHPDLNKKDCLLFLDEPNSALDIKNTLFLYNRIKDLRSKGLTIILVLHQISDCIGLADEIILMQRGSVVLNGPTKLVLENKILDLVFDVSFERIYNENGLSYLNPTYKKINQLEYVR